MGFYTRNLGDIIPRTAQRTIEERSEPRVAGLIERATLFFRDGQYDVPVVNISPRGTMIESGIQPRIGETVTIQFEACDRMRGFVRWVREGRIGINFGHELVLG